MIKLAELGIETFSLDVTNKESIQAVKTKISGLTGGRLDILVNNAGQGYSMPTADYDMDAVQRLVDTNFVAVIAMCTEFTPLLAASGNGKIINMSSIASIIPQPFSAAYNATKAALNAFGNTLRLELQPFNIDVITIIAGAVKTKIFAKSECKLPSTTLYELMRGYFDRAEHLNFELQAMPADVFARDVVAKTLNSPSAWVWSGSFVWVAWMTHFVLPRWVSEYMFSSLYGLTEFNKNLSQIDKDE
ncbi:NAD(P)-binding protein [Sistotremastrum suecicum HHB10207 ss-3]|nr:NAD(P)-binding protein [Sistotremastrum suecicum HHB10207 ss-3]